MAPSPRKDWLLFLLALVLLAVIVALVIAFLSKCTVVRVSSWYGDLEFSGSDGQYGYIESSAPLNCDLYIHLPNHGPVAIRDLSEDMVSEWLTPADKRGDVNGHVGPDGHFKFENGKLVRLRIGRSIAFSNRKDGPWLSLPIAYDRLHEVFGKPDWHERRREDRAMQFR